MSRREDLDRVVRDAALHGAGGSARTAAARLRVQADQPPPDAQPGYAERRRRVADGLERLADDDPDARSRRYSAALAAGDVQLAYAVAREPLPGDWPADVRSVWGSRRELTARLADRLMTEAVPEPDTRSGRFPTGRPKARPVASSPRPRPRLGSGTVPHFGRCGGGWCGTRESRPRCRTWWRRPRRR